MEAGAVNDLRQLSKWIYCVHSFFCFCDCHVVTDVCPGGRALVQSADPGEELGQGWSSSVWALQSLPVVSQTEQDSVSVRDIDVVPIWQDLLSEDAVLSAVGMLEKFTSQSHDHMYHSPHLQYKTTFTIYFIWNK